MIELPFQLPGQVHVLFRQPRPEYQKDHQTEFFQERLVQCLDVLVILANVGNLERNLFQYKEPGKELFEI